MEDRYYFQVTYDLLGSVQDDYHDEDYQAQYTSFFHLLLVS